MQVDPSNSSPGSAVMGAIRQAAETIGTSFDYLLATAKIESGLNPQAGSSTSSARGLFQFIEQTWLSTMKQAGAALGYGDYAAAITQDASGRYQVQDAGVRSEILKLRNDPTVNAEMAGAFTKANAEALGAQLGRPPTESELYIAHFLGVGGAARLITQAASNPGAKAADMFPSAAQANSSIFYDRSGAARSVAQVRDVIAARYDQARGAPLRPPKPSRPRRRPERPPLRRGRPRPPPPRPTRPGSPALSPPPFRKPRPATAKSFTACFRTPTAPRPSRPSSARFGTLPTPLRARQARARNGRNSTACSTCSRIRADGTGTLLKDSRR